MTGAPAILKRQPLVFPKHVRPSGDELKLRCGTCLKYEFGLYVTSKEGRACLVQAICVNCLRIYKIDNAPFETEGVAGTLSINEQNKDQDQ